MAEKKKMSDKVDKRYRTAVTIDGEKVWISAKTKKELERKKETVRKHLRDGYDPDDDIPFVKVIDEWFNTVKVPNFKSPNTHREYNTLLKWHIYPQINPHQMCKAVRYVDLQSVLNKMKGYNCISINLVYGILKHSCQYAVANGYMEYDPSTALVKPLATPPRKRDALTEDQVSRIVSAAYEAGYEGLLVFILYFLGLRVNEATALTWADIDWDNGVVHITKSLNRSMDYKIIVSSTKTNAGTRDVPLPTPLREILKPYKDFPSQRILRKRNGNPLDGPSARELFCKVLYNAGVITYTDRYMQYLKDLADGKKPKWMRAKYNEYITPHHLRHHYCTMMFDAEIPAEVASRFAGHASYSTTAQIYTHIREQRKRKEAVKLDGMFSKSFANILPTDTSEAK